MFAFCCFEYAVVEVARRVGIDFTFDIRCDPLLVLNGSGLVILLFNFDDLSDAALIKPDRGLVAVVDLRVGKIEESC